MLYGNSFGTDGIGSGTQGRRDTPKDCASNQGPAIFSHMTFSDGFGTLPVETSFVQGRLKIKSQKSHGKPKKVKKQTC